MLKTVIRRPVAVHRLRARRTAVAVSVALVGVALTGCAASSVASPSESARTSTAAPSGSPSGSSSQAPGTREVDLEPPSFSTPTEITNPLFPVSDVAQLIQLGDEAGEPLRVEVTLLPETRTIEWDGQDVEAVIAQFVGYSDRRVVEVTLDYFAQADDGSVWYFGEDVDNYEDGTVADHEGSWLAGRDGPPGMIMPAEPRVGDVYHSENIPDLVFEEDTVLAVDETVDGPSGMIDGAIRIRETLMDGTMEHKVFAPGYGEFRAEAADEFATVAIAVPTDALDEPAPDAVTTISAEATAVFAALRGDERAAAEAGLDRITARWDDLKAATLPELLAAQMEDSVASLTDAVAANDADTTMQAAVDVESAALDLELRYSGRSAIDVRRMALWARQAVIDAMADGGGELLGDVATLETTWARTEHAAAASDVDAVASRLEALHAAAESDNFDAAIDAADDLITVVDEVAAS